MGQALVISGGFFDNERFVNRLAYLIGGLAIFILLFSGIDYVVQNQFHIEKINIVGNPKHITQSQLSFIAKNRLHGTFFTLDIDALQYEFRQVPWVKDVTVSRDFPDSITVKINEYDAIARFGDDGLIAQDGKVFNGADDNPLLPVFYTDSSNIMAALKDYKIIQPLLQQNNVTLQKLYLGGTGITKLYLSNNLLVTICGSDITAAWQTLTKYWGQLYQLNPNLTTVNMCYKNALAINSVSSAKINASGLVKSEGNKKGK